MPPIKFNKRPIRLVILSSDSGSNLQTIIDAIEKEHLNAKIVAVVSNRKNAYGLQRAEAVGIDCVYFPLKPYLDAGQSREVYDAELAQAVGFYKPDLILLAGWSHILGTVFLEGYRDKVINLHSALPGQFVGKHPIPRAFIAAQEGVIHRSGVMVHYVTPEVNVGDVIIHAEVPILQSDTLHKFETRMHKTEERLLVQAIALLADKMI